jgi:hypothetical protein
MREMQHVAYMGEIRSAFIILVGKPEREEATWGI